ncbi:hypothetical protein PV-S19_0247 [Pacmanvirus S19]|nr:hypothetical protein PV-S19_0247 [Pacmanvirus S19]
MSKCAKNRLSLMIKNQERIANNMQMFCLNPSLDSFKEICGDINIKRKYTIEFDIWKLACEYKYEYCSISDDFIKKQEEICNKALLKPTRTIIVQLLFIYFATGELKYIDLFYQCMGHESITQQTRQYLSSLYKDTKDKYLNKIAELLSDDKDYFSKKCINLRHVNFSHFDNIKQKMNAIKEQNNIINSAILPKN